MKELAAALLAVQAESPRIQKSAVNPHFKNKYVPMDALLDAILPILNKHGVVLLQPPTVLESGMPGLTTILMHGESGQSIQHTMPLAMEKPTPQGQASATTYARRNALMSMLGLAGHDDDGEVAEPRAEAKSEGDDRPSAAQFRKLEAQLQELTARDMTNEGEPTWEDIMRDHVLETWGKRTRKDLTRGEMSQLIDWADARIKEIDIPFGESA